jgi:predicted TIM-barrel fold metal-dependent hydrolase
MNKLRREIPIERILFGSDYPHPEGVAEPLQYLEEFKEFKSNEIERIFGANLKQLLEGRS